MDNLVIGILGYLVVQFGIGVWVSRRIATEQDYLIAGRKLGVGLAAFSVFATWFGAETVVGAAGAIYEAGLSGGSADPFGYVLCIFLMGVVFAGSLWRRGYTTFADFFRERFSVGVERLAIALMVPPSVIWAAAQIRAFGQVLSSATQLEITWAITTATLLVIAYTTVGGLLADAWTDLIQGIALVVGLIVMLIALLLRAPVGSLLADLPPERFALFGTPDVAWLDVAEAWAIPVLGSVFAVELISRILACNSPTTARRACLLGGSMYLVIGLIPVMLGLVGPQLSPNLEESEQLIPELAKLHLGPFFYILFSGALVSAILSTVDSALLAASSLISHNLIRPLVPAWNERRQVMLARSCVAVLGLAAYAIALNSRGIFELVEMASAFGSAGIVVVTCFGMATTWGHSLAAASAMVIGMIVWIAGDQMHWRAPFLTSLAASTVSYLIAWQFEPRWPKGRKTTNTPTITPH